MPLPRTPPPTGQWQRFRSFQRLSDRRRRPRLSMTQSSLWDSVKRSANARKRLNWARRHPRQRKTQKQSRRGWYRSTSRAPRISWMMFQASRRTEAPGRGGGRKDVPVGFSILILSPVVRGTRFFVHAFFFVDDIGNALERREGFPATPRDRRGLRSGNVSQTFRS